MKSKAANLNLGDTFSVEIVERVSVQEYIVSFDGKLLRLRNESMRLLAPKEQVRVRVTHVTPLVFQMIGDDDKKRGTLKVNISI